MTSTRFTLAQRSAGLLLHPTSLPGPHGLGDLGDAAHELIDFLAAAGLRWWQMLPIGPAGEGNSPYSALSAFAGNPLLISLTRLRADGLLARPDLRPPDGLSDARVNYRAAARFKQAALRRAHAAFTAAGGTASRAYIEFCRAQAGWLDAHAQYMTLRRTEHSAHWPNWPPATRRRRPAALAALERQHARDLDFERFVQFQFARQWAALKNYANGRGVGLIGDIPIFVAHDSSDVWAHPDLFDLLPSGRPRTKSGVPPDLFSRTGQLWNHPHYRWPRHAATDFAWWRARFRQTFSQFDAIRIDHFLGFNRVWAVPGAATTAQRGRWVKTPGRALFASLRRRLGPLEIIAEDLGLLTPAAAALRDECGFPGMRLLHFAFGNDTTDRYHQPHMHPRNCVVYPGTHDNDTTVGWFARLRAEGRRARRRGTAELAPVQRVLRYLGTDGREIHWHIIRLALASPANTAIIPVQDVLGLGSEARMNRPATGRGNWEWRVRPGALTARAASRLRSLVQAYGRQARANPRPAEYDPRI